MQHCLFAWHYSGFPCQDVLFVPCLSFVYAHTFLVRVLIDHHACIGKQRHRQFPSVTLECVMFWSGIGHPTGHPIVIIVR